MSRNRYLSAAELRRAARARAACDAVEADRQASMLAWGWIARAAVVVVPLTIAVQYAWHAWGCRAC